MKIQRILNVPQLKMGQVMDAPAHGRHAAQSSPPGPGVVNPGPIDSHPPGTAGPRHGHLYLVRVVVAATCLMLLLAVPVLAGPPLPPPESPPTPPQGQPSGIPEVVAAMASSVTPTSGQIDVAVTGEHETAPAVALCANDQYLAVYSLNGNIYGQRLTSAGNLLGSRFVIYDGTYYANEPDVACEWSHNRFIVVWTYDYNGTGSDLDVNAQGVHGAHLTSGSQLHGSRIYVSQDSITDEAHPAIACNSDAYTCLVVFEYNGTGNGDIYGQRLAIGSSGISREGDRFNASNFSAQEHHPDVAWGGLDDNYLVAWEYLYNTPSNYYRILYSIIWDTEKGSNPTDEIRRGGTFLTAAGNEQTEPAVAYNSIRREYLVAYTVEMPGGGDWDIYARRLDGIGESSPANPFALVWTGYVEASPAVAFSGGPESFPGGMGADQYLATYVADEGTDGYAVYGVAIPGDATFVDQFLDRVEIDVMADLFGWYLDAPDVTGSVNNGRYMVAWQYHTGGFSPDDDVLGRLLAPEGAVYLPFILNN